MSTPRASRRELLPGPGYPSSANLRSFKRQLVGTDITNNSIPNTIGGVSVQMDGKPAFVQYVSSNQIDVLAPQDTNTGAVHVPVTNA